MKNISVFFQLLMVCFLFASEAFADSLSLKNGDTVRGTIISINREQIKYVPTLTGTELDVPWTDVAKLKSDSIFDLELQGGERVSGTLDYTIKRGFLVKSRRLGKTTVLMADMIQAMPQSLTVSAGGLSQNIASSETQVASTELAYSDSNVQTFGQESEEETPPLTFLRGSTVLLRPGQVEGRVILSYQPTSDYNYGSIQRRLFVANVGLNVGLHERVEGWVYVPFGYATGHSDSFVHANYNSREKSFELLDMSFGFNFLLHPESLDFPEVTLSLSGVAPTSESPPYTTDSMLRLGNGHWSATAGLNFVRSVDPAILFGGISTSYTWPTHDDYGNEYTYGNNGWSYDYYFGLGMAVNDRLSFSARLMGGYRPALRWNNDTEGRFSTDPMWATFGFGYRLSPTMILEPSVTFGLNDEAGDPRISIGVSKKFN